MESRSEHPSHTPAVSSDRRRAVRLRIAGATLLAVALLVAGVRYTIHIRSTEPTLEELIPGSTAARERQVGILIGPFGVSLIEAWEYLQRPGIEALVTVGAGAIVAIGCFRLATLLERAPFDSTGGSGTADSGANDI
ncbi:MAG TPA: hypothetical protein VGJ29_12445 [Vicinamibacterales bacterium]